MKKQKILIAGGAGFVGTVLSPFLHNIGHEITVVDAGWFGNHLPSDINYITDDLFNWHKKDLCAFDTIVFLAGLSNDPMAEFSPKQNFILNTALPAYLAFMAKEAGVKHFIFASSCSVYGYTLNKTYSENDPAICNYPYGISKLQGEKALAALADENFSISIIRQGTVCGYSKRMRLDLAINTLFKNAIQRKKIQLSNHKIWRPILGLNDLCNAYNLCIENKKVGAEIYNISSFNETIGNLADAIANYVYKQFNITIDIEDLGIQDYRNYKVSTEKAQKLLGFEAKDTLDSIIENLAQNLVHYQDFENSAYYNIEIFKQQTKKRVLA